MRSPMGAALMMLLASALVLQAGNEKVPTCDGAVGAWEFIGQPGRGLMSKVGSKFQVMWVAQMPASAGATEAAGQAAECTCAAAPGKLVWKCRIAFSLRPAEVGTDQTYEWGMDGDILKSRLVGPDGKPNEGVGFRRPQ